MEGARQPFSKKRPNPQSKRQDGNKKGRFSSSTGDQISSSSQSSDTVYRILCLSKKIGSVIGKGGDIIKALREETQAKITVADSVSGSDERVVIIYSPSTQIPVKHHDNNGDEESGADKEDQPLQIHCAAQDALLKVHDRIVEEDIIGGSESNNSNDTVVTARLLVSDNAVGCLLGKKGDVIQRLRSETGASIRVLSKEQLPACANSTDELVQISAKPAIARKALYEVSTLLHQNPRKDKVPSRGHGPQGFHPPGPSVPNFLPPGNPMLSERYPNARGMPPMPWMAGRYSNEPSGFGPRGFDDVPIARGGEARSEFSMKILCSSKRIGGVIGRGGSVVKRLEQETGTRIDVDDASAGSDDRVIRVSALEAPWDPRSRTIDAILILQDKTSEESEKGVITTRLLIPSSKVGCILGQGGQVINEMRRRTKADIRVNSKEDKPKCAGHDEELVQVSGNYGVAKDALAEISSRFRDRCLRDASSGPEPSPFVPGPGYGPRGSIPVERPHPSGTIGVDRSGGYEPFKGGPREYEHLKYPAPISASAREHEHVNYPAPSSASGREYEHLNYPVPPSASGRDYENMNYPAPPSASGREYEHLNYPAPPSASGYPIVNSTVDKMPAYAENSVMRPGMSNGSEFGGPRMNLQDPYSGGREGVDIHGSSQHSSTARNAYQAYGGQRNTPPQQGGAYPQDFVSPQPSYHNTIPPQQAPYSYQNYAQEGPLYQY